MIIVKRQMDNFLAIL